MDADVGYAYFNADGCGTNFTTVYWRYFYIYFVLSSGGMERVYRIATKRMIILFLSFNALTTLKMIN